MTRFTAPLTAIALAAAAANAGIASYTDDLTDGAFDAPFSYDFSSDFTGGFDFNEIIVGQGLLLASDEVTITFAASIGEINAATLSIGDFTPGLDPDMTITFLGTMGEVEVYSEADGGLTPNYTGDYTIGYSGTFDLASVTVSGFEAYVRDITVRAVPAPGVLALTGLGGLAATRRRR